MASALKERRTERKRKGRNGEEIEWAMAVEGLVTRILTSRCACYSESEVAQSCPTLCDPMDRGAYQARFSGQEYWRGLPFPSAETSPFTEETEWQVSLVYFIWFCQKTIILTIDLTLVLYLSWNFGGFIFAVKISGNSFLTVVEAALEDSVSGSAHFLIHTRVSLTRTSRATAVGQFSASVS